MVAGEPLPNLHATTIDIVTNKQYPTVTAIHRLMCDFPYQKESVAAIHAALAQLFLINWLRPQEQLIENRSLVLYLFCSGFHLTAKGGMVCSQGT